MRDKYAKWGQNPYSFGPWSSLNLRYFFRQQKSLIYDEILVPTSNFDDNNSENDFHLYKELAIYNQHVMDSQLIQKVEVGEDDQSLYDDIKSVRSFKSQRSVKSEY